MSVCVCVCERERESVCLCVCVCVCVCTCERERVRRGGGSDERGRNDKENSCCNGYNAVFLQERLTVHNAELCDRLAATQHSRTILEREVLTLKRKLLEEKTVNGRLDQLLLSSEREKATLKNQLAQHNSETSHETNLEALNREKVTA